jgi:hypothetical protein
MMLSRRTQGEWHEPEITEFGNERELLDLVSSMSLRSDLSKTPTIFIDPVLTDNDAQEVLFAFLDDLTTCGTGLATSSVEVKS